MDGNAHPARRGPRPVRRPCDNSDTFMRTRWLGPGLFFATLSTLLLETLDARLLSVLTWYHLSFLAVSLAMLGMAGGAVFVFLRPDRFDPDHAPAGAGAGGAALRDRGAAVAPADAGDALPAADQHQRHGGAVDRRLNGRPGGALRPVGRHGDRRPHPLPRPDRPPLRLRPDWRGARVPARRPRARVVEHQLRGLHRGRRGGRRGRLLRALRLRGPHGSSGRPRGGAGGRGAVQQRGPSAAAGDLSEESRSLAAQPAQRHRALEQPLVRARAEGVRESGVLLGPGHRRRPVPRRRLPGS